MRTFLRLLVLLSVLLGATAVAPLAYAGDTGGTGGTGATVTTEGTTAVDDPTGAGGPAGPGDPVTTGGTSGPVLQQTTPTAPDPTAADQPATEPMTVTLGAGSPPAISAAGSARFSFTTNRTAAKFECTLTRVGSTPRVAACPATATTDTATTGAVGYTGLTVGTYTFDVHAVAGDDDAGLAAPYQWRIGAKVVAADRYTVPAGASFNNPIGNVVAQRRNLTHVIRTINSMPGYQVNSQAVCDPSVAAAPSTIRISLYSATDMAFAKALVEAARRCVSVQILMNNHLGPAKTQSIRYLQTYLGAAVFDAGGVRRTFAHRCNFGCRGGGVLHAKFYLFDSALTTPGGARIANTVMVGSSNMTSNASNVQWNDLYTVRGDATLRGQYLSMFQRMQRDRDERRTYQFSAGPYQTTFTPQTPGSVDPTMTALRSIHCLGAAAGTGYYGHTVVYINMHAWFGVRGYAFASQVRAMHDRGCYVRVLYSFMSRSVYTKLTKGTGSRMSVRRTIFADNGGLNATLYSHFKMIAASGYVGADRAASVVWTGSNNFTNDGVNFDEVTMRIASRPAYIQYRDQFAFITRTRTSAFYASFAEPVGGGRAVR